MIRYCERPKWYEIKSGHPYWNLKWKQLYPKSEKRVECSSRGKIKESKCLIYKQARPGKYSIRLEYATSIGSEDRLNRNKVNIKYVREEFAIKKESVDSNEQSEESQVSY